MQVKKVEGVDENEEESCKKYYKKAAFEMAELNANQVCGFFFGQPKQPASVKKLRKF